MSKKMDQTEVLVSPLPGRSKPDSESPQPYVDPPPDRSEPSSELQGDDTERNKQEKTYTQFLAVISKLETLIDKTRPMKPSSDQEELVGGSGELRAKIHTTLDHFRLDLRVWIKDVSSSTDRLPDALEGLAGRDLWLNETLRETLRGMLQHAASMEEALASDMAGSSKTTGDKCDEVLAPCDEMGALVNQLQGLKSRLQTELSSVVLEEKQQDKTIVDHPPSILCLDGGGVRSFVSLLILRKLMRSIDSELSKIGNYGIAPTSSPLKPCEVFDFIFGSSSGGLLAIMLGRLEMSMDECYDKFRSYASEIFGHPSLLAVQFFRPLNEKYSDKRLIRAIRHVVGEFDPSPESTKWRHTIFKDTGGRCKTGVLAYAMPSQNGYEFGKPYMVRSYDCEPKAKPTKESQSESQENLHANPDADCLQFPALNPGPASSFHIWQAARATTAAPGYFKPFENQDGVFYDGGITSNNPTLQVLAEMQVLLSHAPINCMVSIGTGIMPERGSIGITPLLRFVELLRGALGQKRDTERLASAIAGGLDIPYFRFDPELQRRILLDEWAPKSTARRTLGDIEKFTEAFLERGDVLDNMSRCACILARRISDSRTTEMSSTD